MRAGVEATPIESTLGPRGKRMNQGSNQSTVYYFHEAFLGWYQFPNGRKTRSCLTSSNQHGNRLGCGGGHCKEDHWLAAFNDLDKHKTLETRWLKVMDFMEFKKMKQEWIGHVAAQEMTFKLLVLIWVLDQETACVHRWEPTFLDARWALFTPKKQD